jgi:hypothetical protein
MQMTSDMRQRTISAPNDASETFGTRLSSI